MKSDFLNRLSALKNLYATIEQSGFANAISPQSRFTFNMYRWDSSTDNSKRPHNSSIAADFLLEFHDGNIFIDFYIIEDNKDKGNYHGMSVFQPISSRASDDSGKKASEVTILSVETLKRGKSISIISADARTIEQCKEREREHNERVAEEASQNPNKEERKKFLANLEISVPELSKKNRLNKENYYKMIESDLFCSEFSEFDLKNLKSGMEQSLDASNTSEKKRACLEYEIATVETIIELKKMLNELEHLLNPKNFSVDDYWQKLSAISEYLKNQNVGSDLILKVADLIERQKESCDVFTAEVIDYAVNGMKQNTEKKPEDRINFNQSSTVKSGNIKMMQFHSPDADDSVQANIIPNGAVVIPIYNPFRDALRSFADVFKKILHNIQNATEKAKKVNIQGNTDYFTELQSFEQNLGQKTEQEDHSLLSSSIPESKITSESATTIKSEISSVQTETEMEIYDKLRFALELLITTGYFDIPRIFEEVKQDILLENPGIAINDADLEFLLNSYDIQLFQEEPDQNQSNQKQAEYNY